MNKFNPNFTGESDFIGGSHETLQDIRDRVSCTTANNRRRDALSALDKTARLFGQRLSSLRAQPKDVILLFGSKNAAELGVSQKTFQNIRAEVMRSLRAFGTVVPSILKGLLMAPAWMEFLAGFGRSNSRYGLHVFARYCSAVGIVPETVTSADLIGFFDELRKTGVKDPRKKMHQTIAAWNQCAKSMQGWQDRRLSSPFPSSRYRLALEDLPASFQADVETWLRARRNDGTLNFDGPARKQRKVTLDHQRDNTLRFVSILVSEGLLRLDQVVSLQVLVDVVTVRAGLQALYRRGTGEPYVRHYASLLLGIARHHCNAPQQQVEELGKLASRIKQQRGMTPKNRKLLEQFDNEENVEKLFAFPDEERRRGANARDERRQAKFFERALFVELLIFATLRMLNLRNINLDHSIRWNGDECILRFDDDETKNHRSLELPLPPHVGKSLKRFVEVYRPRLETVRGPYLFPGAGGGPKHHSTLAREFKAALKKHCGLNVNVHLMRHIIAKIVLTKDPSLLPALAQRFGHVDLTSMTKFYSSGESLGASRMLNVILEEKAARPSIRKGGRK